MINEKLTNSKILWTNPTPTSNFVSQTITLDSSNYDEYEVIAKISTGSDTCVSSGKIPKNILAQVMFFGLSTTGTKYNLRARPINTKTDTSITFGDNINVFGSTSEISNGQMIPLYVIGYKTGLF